ncbi:hypothetical protein [Sphaerotilus microaerophilus]|uniref:Uncharacterized protein n=1 Tax=Sphaerotilus microaerophilus TaxID=2914710 RepID=A0ABN6PFH9_9BURK|nr:hypothetical protein [Sphaerotilus sp. FB-5]BDI03683.1 hypothetical protein CATMQ487_06530 [Sphaerotilus sp. FB-5]
MSHNPTHVITGPDETAPSVDGLLTSDEEMSDTAERASIVTPVLHVETQDGDFNVSTVLIPPAEWPAYSDVQAAYVPPAIHIDWGASAEPISLAAPAGEPTAAIDSASKEPLEPVTIAPLVESVSLSTPASCEFLPAEEAPDVPVAVRVDGEDVGADSLVDVSEDIVLPIDPPCGILPGDNLPIAIEIGDLDNGEEDKPQPDPTADEKLLDGPVDDFLAIDWTVETGGCDAVIAICKLMPIDGWEIVPTGVPIDADLQPIDLADTPVDPITPVECPVDQEVGQLYYTVAQNSDSLAVDTLVALDGVVQ